jgi:hypothetical protein
LLVHRIRVTPGQSPFPGGSGQRGHSVNPNLVGVNPAEKTATASKPAPRDSTKSHCLRVDRSLVIDPDDITRPPIAESMTAPSRNAGGLCCVGWLWLAARG